MVSQLIRLVLVLAPQLLIATVSPFGPDRTLAPGNGPTKGLPRSRPRISLTISAAISLKDALEDIKIRFEKEHPVVAITFNFGASGMLQQQIENGAPVDIFCSAGVKQMDTLEAKRLLLAGTRQDLAGNQLVLIVPRESSAIAGFPDLARPNVRRIAFGEPASVPAGQYAEEALRYLKLFDLVKPKTVLAKDVRQVLTYVETGNVDAGIVYRSDVFENARVKIVAEAPADSHTAIRYPAAVIRASRHPDEAREFLVYLRSESASKIFQNHGFLVAVHSSV